MKETYAEYLVRARLGVPPEEFPEAWEPGTPEHEERLKAEVELGKRKLDD